MERLIRSGESPVDIRKSGNSGMWRTPGERMD